MDNEYLEHHGIKDMKWGVRRYQNKDGSLTPAGKKRAAKLQKEYESLTGKKTSKESSSSSSKPSNEKSEAPKPKSVKEMSDAELNAVVNRLQLEQKYARLNPKQVSKGKKFAEYVFKQVVAPVATDIAKNSLRDAANKALKSSSKGK